MSKANRKPAEPGAADPEQMRRLASRRGERRGKAGLSARRRRGRPSTGWTWLP
ncbi:MAG: hypothetical protein ACLR0P_01000 [Oscillospiraceae bacterium]